MFKKDLVIPESKVKNFRAKVKLLSKRSGSLRLGLKVEDLGKGIEDFNGKKYKVNYYRISYETPVILSKYKIVGTVTVNNKVNIIHKINNEIILPKDLSKREAKCEHCNIKRNRKYLYIVKYKDDVKFIGKSCLKNYLNLDVEQMFKYMEDIEDIGASYDNFEPNDDESLINVNNYIKNLALLLQTDKFKSANHVGYDAKGNVKYWEATSYKALQVKDLSSLNPKYTNSYFKELYYKLVNKIDSEDLGSLGYNVGLIVKDGYCLRKNLELLTYGVYKELKVLNESKGLTISGKSLEDERKQKAKEITEAKNKYQYAGNEGDMLELKVKYLGKSKLMFNYNLDEPTVMYRFEGFEGEGEDINKATKKYLIVWATNQYFNLNKDDIYKIKGKVKKQNEYQNNKQTFITRAKLYESLDGKFNTKAMPKLKVKSDFDGKMWEDLLSYWEDRF